jgi:PAS domain S-box-containing protein
MAEEFSFRDIVELAQDVIIVTKAAPLDPPGPLIVYVNPAFTRLTGYSREEAIGQNPRILQGKDTDSTTTHSIREKLERADPVHVAIQNYARDGRSYWLDLSIMPLRNAKGETTHFVAIERDVSLQKALERKLEELAQRDALTGLYNRRKYFESLDTAWSRFCDTHKPFALITIDIDYFKNVNDTRGHDCGDTVLKRSPIAFGPTAARRIWLHASAVRNSR